MVISKKASESNSRMPVVSKGCFPKTSTAVLLASDFSWLPLLCCFIFQKAMCWWKGEDTKWMLVSLAPRFLRLLSSKLSQQLKMPFSASGGYTDDMSLIWLISWVDAHSVIWWQAYDLKSNSLVLKKKITHFLNFLPWSLCFYCTKFRKLTLWRQGGGKKQKPPHPVLSLKLVRGFWGPVQGNRKELQEKQQHRCAECSGNE